MLPETRCCPAALGCQEATAHSQHPPRAAFAAWMSCLSFWVISSPCRGCQI